MNTRCQQPGDLADPAPWVDRLTTIEGFDVRLALRYTGGDAALLLRVLRRFVATYRHGLPTLQDIDGSEHDVMLRWRSACHSLRGALAMIGARQLTDSVGEFERALRDPDSRASLSARGRQLHELLRDFAAQLATETEYW